MGVPTRFRKVSDEVALGLEAVHDELRLEELLVAALLGVRVEWVGLIVHDDVRLYHTSNY